MDSRESRLRAHSVDPNTYPGLRKRPSERKLPGGFSELGQSWRIELMQHFRQLPGVIIFDVPETSSVRSLAQLSGLSWFPHDHLQTEMSDVHESIICLILC